MPSCRKKSQWHRSRCQPFLGWVACRWAMITSVTTTCTMQCNSSWLDHHHRYIACLQCHFCHFHQKTAQHHSVRISRTPLRLTVRSKSLCRLQQCLHYQSRTPSALICCSSQLTASSCGSPLLAVLARIALAMEVALCLLYHHIFQHWWLDRSIWHQHTALQSIKNLSLDCSGWVDGNDSLLVLL